MKRKILTVKNKAVLYKKLKAYLESQSGLDSFYWNTLGRIVYNEHFKR